MEEKDSSRWQAFSRRTGPYQSASFVRLAQYLYPWSGSFHGISGFVLNAHGGFCYSSPTAKLLTEIRVPIRYRTLCIIPGAIFFPEDGQIGSGFCKLSMNAGVVRNLVKYALLIFLWKKQFHEISLVQSSGSGQLIPAFSAASRTFRMV